MTVSSLSEMFKVIGLRDGEVTGGGGLTLKTEDSSETACHLKVLTRQRGCWVGVGDY